MMTLPEIKSIYHSEPAPNGGETFHTLLEKSTFRIEKIISRGTKSDTDFWYDQNTDEWVLLLEGNACLEFENSQKVLLNKGDYLLIPSHCKHRVESTSDDAVWLAIHC